MEQTPLLDLTISNPTLCLADYPHKTIQKALGQVQNFEYCPDPFGLDKARSAIADYYRAEAIFLTTQQLLLTASTSEAYSQLFKLLCDPEDEVLTPLPSYPLFDYLAALESVKLKPYRLQYDGAWHLDFASLRAQVSNKTKAIIVVNPNNPTGTFLTGEERKELLCFAKQLQIPLISDEVFADYLVVPNPSIAKTFADNDEVLSFSLNGLSKMAGMPQMKLAWIVIGGPTQDRQMARERLEIIADTYLSVSTPVQQVLPDLLEAGSAIRSRLQQRIGRNLEMIDSRVKESPVQRLHFHGGWSAILQLPRILTEENWVQDFLKEQNVLVQPGYFFDMASEAYVVLSLIVPEDQMVTGIERICAQVTKHC